MNEDCEVVEKGKYFIVIDHVHNTSYPLNNRISADNLCNTLNKAMKGESELIKVLTEQKNVLDKLRMELENTNKIIERILL